MSDGMLSPARDLARIGHVDGLRAIAVLAVVGFHAGIPGFGGGFVGVDVFFVISGYLIINHIVDELRGNRFSLPVFYARRVLRILPPLLVVLLACTAVAAVILVSPYEWEWFTLSAFTAAVSASNFYFLSKQGYFDFSTWEKPLLHTWSLSVEEQFYLVAPLLLMGVFALGVRSARHSGRALMACAVLVFAASLAACIWLSQPAGDERNFGFYLMPLRAWEFVAGGAIGAFGAKRLAGVPRWAGEAAACTGLVAILLSVLFYHGEWAYPGYLAALPVIGTVLTIWGGLAAPRALSARLISLPLLTGIGLISYSWYLWHWPFISFARIADFGDVSLPRDVLMAVLSLGPALLTYRYVEQPARRWREARDLRRLGWRPMGGGVAACIGVAALCGTVGGGAYWWMNQNPMLSEDSAAFVAASACPPDICRNLVGHRGSLMGDSHSDRLGDPLERETERLGIALDRSISPGVGDFVILARRWAPYFEEHVHGRNYERTLADFMKAASEGGRRRVLIVGPVPEFPRKGAQCVLRAERYGLDLTTCGIARDKVEARRKQAVDTLKDLVSVFPNTRYVDPLDLFCDATVCLPYKDGILVTKDTNHITEPYASDWLFAAFKEDFWWALGGDAPGLAKR